MTDARERLVTLLNSVAPNVEAVADALLAAGVTLAPEPPAPRPVWPGLEGEGLRKLRSLFTDAYDAEVRAGKRDDAACRAACTAQAAHLWRAMVASLPDASESGTGPAGWVHISGAYYTSRASLAALADPYDGGGKGVGK